MTFPSAAIGHEIYLSYLSTIRRGGRDERMNGTKGRERERERKKQKQLCLDCKTKFNFDVEDITKRCTNMKDRREVHIEKLMPQ